MRIECTNKITVRCIQHMGSDEAIVAAAKVSTTGHEVLDLRADEYRGSNQGLINYLMKHRHGTPFEHSAATFFVHAPIFVWREWHRHRIGFSYNEESARYHTLEPVFYIPDKDRPMFKVDNWKPGRPKFLTIEDFDRANPNDPTPGTRRYEMLCRNLRDSYVLAYSKYRQNLILGFDPGLARDCLPVGIYSSCWVTCNPRSLMAFLSLRTHNPDAAFVSYPLYEIEVAAEAAEQILELHWPMTHAAFVANGRVAP